MAIDIKAPAFPESVADGEIAAWHKQEGEAVARDELIVEIETDNGHVSFLLDEPELADAVSGFLTAAARKRGLTAPGKMPDVELGGR